VLVKNTLKREGSFVAGGFLRDSVRATYIELKENIQMVTVLTFMNIFHKYDIKLP